MTARSGVLERVVLDSFRKEGLEFEDAWKLKCRIAGELNTIFYARLRDSYPHRLAAGISDPGKELDRELEKHHRRYRMLRHMDRAVDRYIA